MNVTRPADWNIDRNALKNEVKKLKQRKVGK
jgi:hypothetical protein